MPSIAELNVLSVSAARAEFLKCCGSRRWADGMIARRPFADTASLAAAADDIWSAATRDDCLEAFAAHLKIGSDVESLRTKFAHTARWSSQEQAGISSADETTIRRLAELNRVYDERFGCIFIVCATGKSASEMLAILESRLGNNPVEELRIAAEEQRKIMHLRLAKLCP
ncbi:MAG TPA: 2-oxo-4-hydroxy-4-carboxy-5-ureidoimidazoline decarboxylase [Gemmataceae bacterium]|jgi:2-oxo-4-hydroxy-4-carboxy-5-ureidoimidazoline decarboxylase|nr:2-oxo-4-hydroxy-4-carboxy-5-ureidoimidazoline decarboxylase [Gemmataceae bacterium]